MEKIFNKYLFTIIFLSGFYIPQKLFAACIGSSPNLTAASANMSDVADCVTISTYGDTINIPVCAAGDCIWTSGINIAKDIKIIGAGVDETILTMGFTNNSINEAFFKFEPDAESRNNLNSLSKINTFEIAGITFSGSRLTNKFGVWVYNTNIPVIKRIRIHHNKFTSIHRAVQVLKYVHGVFDSNILIDSNASYPQGAGLDAFTNDIRITGSSDSWYIEDNDFSFVAYLGDVSGAVNDGGSQVVRYNTVNGDCGLYVEAHSNQTSFIKGGYFTEIYGNNFAATTHQGGIDMRGGKDIIFFNKITNASPRVREEFSDGASGSLPPNQCASNSGCTATGIPWACCTGSGTGTCNPQICTDSCTCWKVNNTYLWNNRQSASNDIIPFPVTYDRYDNVNTNDPLELVENREFWNQRPEGTFDGTGNAAAGGGVGCGTLAARPATCTTGVGYWVTNQSCSDLTGMIGANPSTPIYGTLYKCTAPDIWTAYYTPYTYPHPLRTEYTDATSPAAPQGLSVR